MMAAGAVGRLAGALCQSRLDGQKVLVIKVTCSKNIFSRPASSQSVESKTSETVKSREALRHPEDRI